MSSAPGRRSRQAALGSRRGLVVRPARFLGIESAAPVIALVAASLMWGTSDVAGKLALESIPPATLAALRFGVALAIFWPLARMKHAPKAPRRVVAPLGVLGVALVFLLQNFGLERTAAANASILQGAVPVVTLLLAVVILGERLGVRRVISVLAAALGVAAVTLSTGSGLQAPGAGDLLVLASAGCFAAFVVLGRHAFPRYGTLSILSGMTAWGTAALIPVAAGELWIGRPTSIGLSDFGLILYLGAGCSALTYALWGYALCHLEAGCAAIFDALIPIVGVISAMLVLREAPLGWHLVGGGLVVAGVLVSVRDTSQSSGSATAENVAPKRVWSARRRWSNLGGPMTASPAKGSQSSA